MAFWLFDAAAKALDIIQNLGNDKPMARRRRARRNGGTEEFQGSLYYPRKGGQGKHIERIIVDIGEAPGKKAKPVDVSPISKQHLNDEFGGQLEIGFGTLEKTRRQQIPAKARERAEAEPMVKTQKKPAPEAPKIEPPQHLFIVLRVEDDATEDEATEMAIHLKDAIFRHLRVPVELHAAGSTEAFTVNWAKVEDAAPVAEPEEPENLPLRMDKNLGLVPAPPVPEVPSSDEDELPLPPEDETVVDMAEARRLLEETPSDAETVTRH